MKLRALLAYVLMFSMLVLLSACGGGGTSGSAGPAKTAIKVNFHSQNGAVAKASISDIHFIEVDALSQYGDQQSTAGHLDGELSFNNSNGNELQDNEIYTFQVTAIDSDWNTIYSGLAVQKMNPGQNEVVINCYETSGFDAFADSTYELGFGGSTEFEFSVDKEHGAVTGQRQDGTSINGYVAATSTKGTFAFHTFGSNGFAYGGQISESGTGSGDFYDQDGKSLGSTWAIAKKQ